MVNNCVCHTTDFNPFFSFRIFIHFNLATSQTLKFIEIAYLRGPLLKTQKKTKLQYITFRVKLIYIMMKTLSVLVAEILQSHLFLLKNLIFQVKLDSVFSVYAFCLANFTMLRKTTSNLFDHSFFFFGDYSFAIKIMMILKLLASMI